MTTMTPAAAEAYQPVPAAALVKLVRKGAGIPISRAADLGGISEVRWMQVEKGEEKRRGDVRRAIPRPDTIAAMALGVNRAAGHLLISPERLETEGRDPEAAMILREALRQDAATQPRSAVSAISTVLGELNAADADAGIAAVRAEGPAGARDWRERDVWEADDIAYDDKPPLIYARRLLQIRYARMTAAKRGTG